MKKTLLAAALMFGFAGVAQAETSVTLYGLIDGGIAYQQLKGSTSRTGAPGFDFKQSKFGMSSGLRSGPRWGLKGTEDLGSGLKAVFQLESGFNLGTGYSTQDNRLFGRQATLGLASDSWGRLDFGRQSTVGSKYLPSIVDPFGAGFNQSNMGSSFSSVNTMRWDNMVMYQTPNFSGFQFGVGYSFNVDGSQLYKRDNSLPGFSDDQNKRGITTALRYVNGPIGVALTYDQFKTPERFGVDATTAQQWNIGGAYDFEVVKVSLAYGQTRDGWFTGQDMSGMRTGGTFVAADGFKANSYLVGLSAPLGNGKLMASWTMADPRDKPNAALATEDYSKLQVFSLGYSYNLSKRTDVYAIGSYAKHVNFLPDAKSTVVGVGVRHQF